MAAVSCAILADANGTRLAGTYDPLNASALYAVMDSLGEQGWIIGEPRWIDFRGTHMIYGTEIPDWIKAALQDYMGTRASLTGYNQYLMRRSA
jgi:hypothetical protein